MADIVITCSGMARESYVTNGVSPEKVHSILLGGELPHGVRREAETQHPARFIFAGTLSVRKSIDLILEAFARLNADGHRADDPRAAAGHLIRLRLSFDRRHHCQ